MGAIASGGVAVINDDVACGPGISPEVIGQVAEREGRELLRREQAYREGRPFPEVAGKVVIVVGDGLATGLSMRAAVEALQRLRPAAVVVAVPPAPESTCRELNALGRQGGLRDHAVAVLRGRGVLLGLHPDHRRRGPGPPSRGPGIPAGCRRRARSDGGSRHPGRGGAGGRRSAGRRHPVTRGGRALRHQREGNSRS
jgi:hypothetical protein